jgi:beta-D-xylosidase 4
MLSRTFTIHTTTLRQPLKPLQTVSKQVLTLIAGLSISLNLGTALSQGLIEDADLDRALNRLYSSLIKLGYFDDPAVQPYRALSWSDVNTENSQQLAYTAAISGIVLLKNDGILPITSTDKKIALVGPWANSTTQMQGNYAGVAPFLHSPFHAAEKLGLDVTYTLGTEINSTDTSGFAAALAAGNTSDIIIFAGGIDNSIEAEGKDRPTIVWPGNQLNLISQLLGLGKPVVVLQMGGGQVDDSSLLDGGNSTVNALIWGGYPGQDGGTALFDIITGKQAPAGRLPITQYPADYVNQIPITNMSLRPGSGNPGRTYKWYSQTPVVEFGTGFHYTNFDLSWAAGTDTTSFDIQELVGASSADWDSIERKVFTTYRVRVANTGDITSDYVALLFLKTTAGPDPAPSKSLVSYTRVHRVKAGSSGTAILPVTLGSLARVDENGLTNIYPGEYSLVLDVPDQLTFNFTLTGQTATLEEWPVATASE